MSDSTIEPTTDQSDSKRALSALVIAFSPNPGTPAEVQLGDGDLEIGRDVDAPGLRLPDRSVSRRHARVVWDSHFGTYRFGDAGSAHGSRINGLPAKSVALDHGDVIRVGDTMLVYREGTVMADVRARADALAPSDLNVLLRGATGVGKEVLARRIHASSGRSGPFVPINCAALTPELLTSELFGHAKGAFSGAVAARQGAMRTAEGGTLFLDEVTEMDGTCQASLLRAIQERAVRPVGTDVELAVDVRIVSATNADVEQRVSSDQLREDLVARLGQVSLAIPPLRERRDEIMPLFLEFLGVAGKPFRLSPDAAEALLVYDWPRNVREAQSAARALSVESEGPGLDATDLRRSLPQIARVVGDSRLGSPEAGSGEDAPLDRDLIIRTLAEHDGNVAAAARALGKPRSTLYRWLRAHDVNVRKFR